jgi:fucose permease
MHETAELPELTEGMLGRSADRLAGRFGARAVLIAGLVLIAGALVLFAQAPIHGG